MKIIDKIAGRDASNPFYFFEFFPPRTDQGFENLLARISRLAALKPLAVSITWGAGGSTRDRSLDLAGITQKEYHIDTLLHLTCTNMLQGMVDDALNAARSRGIQNILALRGDPPKGKEEWIPIDPRFQHGVDLVSYIRSSSQLSSHFCIGVAGYPDGHPDTSNDEDTELDYLKAKVDAGADFIVTQLFYDVDQFLRWKDKARAKGITVPIIPGIMPIQTYSSFLRLIKLCGTSVPEQVMQDLEPIKHDDQLVKDYGVALAVTMIRRLTTEGEIPGVHFCTLNLEKSVQRVLETLQWTGIVPPPHNKLIDDHTSPDGLTVTPTTASKDAKYGLAALPSTEKEVGSGELNNAASWDDFPNGRFGDFKSPAYGNQDPWGNVANLPPGEWGNPKTIDDLTRIFLDYLNTKSQTTPFSLEPLCPESIKILSHLKKLTERGWWTVGSQPAVDGASSDDEVFGWGPRCGFVFQKGFVEFFCEESDVDVIEKRVEDKGKGWVHWFAANSKGDFRGNVADYDRNAVTWGVFPGQEIIQTTIIERESFLSWKDEAFSIWSEWASYYRPTLTNGIVHHDYKDTEALWKFLFE
ncbi:methylenetetrahydrofolate reduct [Hymenopellis radicata]|nr:methylenetetrahydrofolate reduct [Hymenopellis radicata]